MATAKGDWTPPMVIGVKLVAAVVLPLANRVARLSELTVLEPVFATRAMPVASFMATPLGFVPTLTSGTISTGEQLDAGMGATGAQGANGARFRMEAVLLPLLVTTARPKGWLMAMPCGLVPTATAGPYIWPRWGFGWPFTVGLMSSATTLLQPVTLIKANGEKGPLENWSAMATEVGIVVALLGFVQAWDKSTA